MTELFFIFCFVAGTWAGVKGGSALAYWQHEKEQKRNAARVNAAFQKAMESVSVADRQFSSACSQIIANILSS